MDEITERTTKAKSERWTDIKEKDSRPAKGWWAPGEYICKCINCEEYFIGDKRAGHCADCEYDNNFQDFQI